MKTQHGSLPTFLTICLSLFLIPLAVTAAATGPLQPTASPSSSSSWGAAFPTLRWLRDSAVELIFGSSARSKDLSDAATWAAVHKRYADHVVVRFNVTNQAEEEALRKGVDMFFLDVWAIKSGEYVDVGLSRDKLGRVKAWLPHSLHEPFVVAEDVAARVWATYPGRKRFGEGRVGGRERGGIEEWEERVGRRGIGKRMDGLDNMFFRDYQPLSVITSWLKLLEAMFPSHAKLITIGSSYEGREILGIRMGARSPDDGGVASDKRKTVLITGGIHSREWISTSSVNYLIWALTTSYDKDTLITKFLEHYDVVLVPVVNPDGYAYTWTDDRLWRKSRQATNMAVCPGLDLDHAFGYEWAGGGASRKQDPCSESYGGDKPFQAVEAAQLADWAANETESNGVKFVGLLDLHSYSQQILYPYSYSCGVDPPNRENLEELAVGLSKAIRLSSGELYSVESACEGAVAGDYSASGSMARVEAGGGSFMDWFYHEMGAHFSYQVKLRDTGSYGFLLPAENIVPTGEEMYAAVRYFADYLLGNNGREKLAVNEEQPVERPFSSLDPITPGTGERWTELRRRADV